jgi:hypothetical protein
MGNGGMCSCLFLPIPWCIWRETPELGAIFPEKRGGGAVRRRANAGRLVSCRTMKHPGPLLTTGEGDAAPQVPVEAAILQRPHPIAPRGITASATTPSKACASKKTGTTHLPHAPKQPPMAQSIPASTPTATKDCAMDDAQQVFEESPTRFVLILVPKLAN